MTEAIATIRLSRATPFLLQTAGFSLIVGLFAAFVISEYFGGETRPDGVVVLLLLIAISARFFYGQALILLRGLAPNRAALWIAGDRLIYLSPLYSSLPLTDLGAIDLQVLRRGLGNQPYGVITNGSGRKMYVHLSILNESLEHLKDRLKGLIRA